MLRRGDRIKVYGTGRKLTCLPAESLYIELEGDKGTVNYNSNGYVELHLDNLDIEVVVHEKQCRKLKKKILKKEDFKIGSSVEISPEYSTWFCEHLDIYYYPNEEHSIRNEYKAEVAFHMLVSLQNITLIGKVVGYGSDDSVKVDMDTAGIIPTHSIRPCLIGVEYLSRGKK